MNTSLKQFKSRAFTIVELLIVIAIIGILAGLSIITYSGVQKQAIDKSILSDISAIESEIARYSTNNGGNLGSAVAWYSGGSANSNIDFIVSKNNVIDVVSNTGLYCIRGYNPASTKNSITNSYAVGSTPDACTVLNPSVVAGGDGEQSLLGWWKLNGDALDSSGNGNHGAQYSATSSTGANGVANGAYSYDGLSSQTVIADSATISPTGSMSVSLWAKPSVINGSLRGIISKDVSSGISNAPYEIALDPSNRFYWRTVNASNATSVSVVCTQVTVVAGTWYHIAVTFNGATMRIFVNNQQCTNTASATGIADTAGPLRFGQQKDTYDRWFGGNIDDVRLYNKALSAAEVTSIYGAGAQ